MKKLTYMLAAVLTMGILAGCGAAEKAESQESMESIDLFATVDLDSFSDVAQNKPVEDYVTLGDYKGVEVTVAKTVATEAEIDALALQFYLADVNAENGGITDRAIKEGDTANIDYVGKKDGVAFNGGTAKGYDLGIGSGTFIPGFEEGLIGVKPGETVDIKLSFPENYQAADLAGQAVVFTVTVNYILPTEIDEKVIPELGNSNYTNMEELKAYAKASLDEQNEAAFQSEAGYAVLNTVMNNAVFAEIPQEILESQRKAVNATLEMYEYYYGITPETYAYYYGMDLETFIEEQAQAFAREMLICQAVANAEGLNVSDRELEETLLTYASQVGASSVEEYLGDVDREEYRESLMMEKVYNFIQENAVVTAE